MAETLSPAQSHRQVVLQQLLEQSDGWKLVLGYCYDRLQKQEAMLLNPEWPAERRLDAIGRKAELTLLLQSLYHQAGIPSPLDAYLLAFTASIQLPPPPTMPAPASTPVEPNVARMPPRRRSAGGVA